MKSFLPSRILAISCIMLFIHSNAFCQGYESIEENDYLSPVFFYDLFGVDSTYIAKRKPKYSFNFPYFSAGVVANYQFRNSFTRGNYLHFFASDSYYTNYFQVNGKFITLHPLEDNVKRITRGKLQLAFYPFADATYDLKFKKKTRRDSLRRTVSPEPMRLLLSYAIENHKDSLTFHELGFEFFIGAKLPNNPLYKSIQGGYFFSWRLNTRDFLYGIAYDYALNHIPVDVLFGISRNKINGNDRWGNVKVGARLKLGLISETSIIAYYNFSRDLRMNFNNNEVGIALGLQSFSSLEFLDNKEKK